MKLNSTQELQRALGSLAEHDRETQRLISGVESQRLPTRTQLLADVDRAQAACPRVEVPFAQTSPFLSLPHELTRIIFGKLPADARMWCLEVCKEWKEILDDHRLWLSLDLSPTSGVRSSTEGLLRAASRRAGGQLRVLDVSDMTMLSLQTLCTVARENAANLVELRAWDCLYVSNAEEKLSTLLTAAPHCACLSATLSLETMRHGRFSTSSGTRRPFRLCASAASSAIAARITIRMVMASPL